MQLQLDTGAWLTSATEPSPSRTMRKVPRASDLSARSRSIVEHKPKERSLTRSSGRCVRVFLDFNLALLCLLLVPPRVCPQPPHSPTGTSDVSRRLHSVLSESVVGVRRNVPRLHTLSCVPQSLTRSLPATGPQLHAAHAAISMQVQCSARACHTVAPLNSVRYDEATFSSLLSLDRGSNGTS
jgi:hypothetical protein